jgi:hypothetical protein
MPSSTEALPVQWRDSQRGPLTAFQRNTMTLSLRRTVHVREHVAPLEPFDSRRLP